MRQAHINLPYININLVDRIEEGSLESFSELPAHYYHLTSALTGKKHDIFAYVTSGAEPVDNYDRQMAVKELAKQFYHAVLDSKLFGEDDLRGDNANRIEISVQDFRNSLEMDSPEWLTMSEQAKKEILFAKWQRRHGESIAQELLSAVPNPKAPPKPNREPTVAFNPIEGGALKASIEWDFYGVTCSVYDENVEDVKSGYGMVLNYGRPCYNLRAGYTYSSENDFTIMVPNDPGCFPPSTRLVFCFQCYEAAEWFDKDYLVQLASEAIATKRAAINDFFFG